MCISKQVLQLVLGALLGSPALVESQPWQPGGECAPIEVFADGVISNEQQWQWRLTFTPSRLQAYWSVSDGFWPATREPAVIKTAYRLPGDRWSSPATVPFSGQYADMDPFIAPDGRTLYFSSMRPVHGQERDDMDLWMVRRHLTGWGEPIHLGRDVNADGYDELYPSIDFWGNLYFARVQAPVPTEDVDIWRSRRRADGRFAPPERLGPGVNTAQRWEFNPEISPDGRTLLFTRLDLPGMDVPDPGFGFGDLYASRLRHGQFQPAQNLGPCVNSSADEYHPTVLWERRELYFVRSASGPGQFLRTRLRLP